MAGNHRWWRVPEFFRELGPFVDAKSAPDPPRFPASERVGKTLFTHRTLVTQCTTLVDLVGSRIDEVKVKAVAAGCAGTPLR